MFTTVKGLLNVRNRGVILKGKLNQKIAREWPGKKGSIAYLWDTSLRGFGLRVNPTGGRFWVARFPVGEGKTEMLTLGRLEELTAEEARNKAQKALQDARAGRNPRVERDDARMEATFEGLVRRFETDVLATRVKQSGFHAKNLRRLTPWFKGVKVKDLTLDRVDRFRAEYGHTAPVNFNRCIATLSTLLNHAEIWGMRPVGSNPCQRIRRFKEEPRERLLTEEELARLGDQIRIFRIAGGTNRQLADLVELILLTGARVSELLKATWGQVDDETQTLTLTDSKTGKGRIRLPERAIRILESMGDPDTDMADDFLFPGRAGVGHLKGYHVLWNSMREAAELTDVRIHDLRHVLASYSHRLGASRRTIADLLRHKKPTMTDRYIQGFSQDQRDASEKTSAKIGEVLEGSNLRIGVGPGLDVTAAGGGNSVNPADGVEDV